MSLNLIGSCQIKLNTKSGHDFCGRNLSLSICLETPKFGSFCMRTISETFAPKKQLSSL